MIELEHDRLEVSFPEVFGEAMLTIEFQRTLRIPDDGREYPLPPGLGPFPVRHLDDFSRNVPRDWLKRGGVLVPMWQSEALWLNFDSQYVEDREAFYPFAIKVATGKRSAVNGKTWRAGLNANPQDYLVVPTQPWLDGYCVEKGVIRQFVAMPLGEGYTVEEQLSGKAEVGGMQLEIFPMRREVFEKRFPKITKRRLVNRLASVGECYLCDTMGLAPGGRMRQEIYEDPFRLEDWDLGHSSRCFVHLVNSSAWRQITGQAPPSQPIRADQYTAAGYPWFDYFDAEHNALAGSKILARVKSVKEKAHEKRSSVLKGNNSLEIRHIVNLRAGLRPRQVRELARVE
jgi:hypothetical protein